jgi:hypothetical protein
MVDDMRDIEELRVSPSDVGLHRESEEIRRWEQRAGGATDTFAGIHSSLAGRTATEANILAQASGSRAGLMLQLLGDQALKRLGRLLIRINEIHIDEPKLIRIAGPRFADQQEKAAALQPPPQAQGPAQPGPLAALLGGGAPLPNMPFPTSAPPGPQAAPGYAVVNPEDLVSENGMDLDLRISIVASEPETRQSKIQRAMGMLKVLGDMGFPPVHPLFDEVLIELAEGFDFENPAQLVAEGKEVMMQQFQAAMAQQAGGPGGAGPKGPGSKGPPQGRGQQAAARGGAAAQGIGV